MGRRGAGLAGGEVTRPVTGPKNLIRRAIAHDGLSFVEVIPGCTGIYGRKNDLCAYRSAVTAGLHTRQGDGIMSHMEIRFSGGGGQGPILAAKILAAALVGGGASAAQSQSCEPAARGALVSLGGPCSEPALETAPKARSPQHFARLNIGAPAVGRAMVSAREPA